MPVGGRQRLLRRAPRFGPAAHRRSMGSAPPRGQSAPRTSWWRSARTSAGHCRCWARPPLPICSCRRGTPDRWRPTPRGGASYVPRCPQSTGGTPTPIYPLASTCWSPSTRTATSPASSSHRHPTIPSSCSTLTSRKLANPRPSPPRDSGTLARVESPHRRTEGGWGAPGRTRTARSLTSPQIARSLWSAYAPRACRVRWAIMDDEARRTFAVPPASGEFDGIDLALLDPSDPDERRMLIIAEHPDLAPAVVAGRRGIHVRGEPISPELHISMHQIVTNQLWHDDPPEVWQTVKRLSAEGYDRHEVLHMLASVVSDQTYNVLKHGKPFDADRMRADLERLPESWERARSEIPQERHLNRAERRTAQRRSRH